MNIQNGKLYVNGAEEKQEGTLGETLTEENNQVSYPLTVGDDQIFVLGDNREVSDDSRAFGVVDMDDVKEELSGIWDDCSEQWTVLIGYKAMKKK